MSIEEKIALQILEALPGTCTCPTCGARSFKILPRYPTIAICSCCELGHLDLAAQILQSPSFTYAEATLVELEKDEAPYIELEKSLPAQPGSLHVYSMPLLSATENYLLARWISARNNNPYSSIYSRHRKEIARSPSCVEEGLVTCFVERTRPSMT